MGSLRTIFAISVVFEHCYGHVFVGGRNAVQLFYFVSGFLISYVLLESKNYSNKRDFYINRFLRLYPIYYVVILLTVVTLAVSSALFKVPASALFDIPDIIKIWQESPIAAKILLTSSNIFLFGQDWLMFLGVENGSLVLTSSFAHSDVVLWHGLIIPQSWTLGLELSFYLLAPFVISDRKATLTLLACSILLRIILIKIGIGLNDPWTYRFFPTELALFLIGSLSHQILYPFYRELLRKKIDMFSKISTYFLIIFSVVFYKLPISELYKTMILFGFFIMLLPLSFHFNNKNKWDRYVGDLSYPIYIGHMLVIYLVIKTMRALAVENKIFIAIICVVLSVFFAMLLNEYVGNRIENIRDKFRFKMLKPTQSARA